MKQNEDYTLFAWSLHYDCFPSLTGVLASSPADFSESVPIRLGQAAMLHDPSNRYDVIDKVEFDVDLLDAEIGFDRLTSVGQLSLAENNWTRKFPQSLSTMQDPPQQTSRGLRISIPVKLSEDPSALSMAWIYCFRDGRPVCVFIDRLKSSANLYARQMSSWLVTIPPEKLTEFKVMEIYIHPTGVIGSSNTRSTEPKQEWGRIRLVHEDNQECSTVLVSVDPMRNWNRDKLFYTGQPKLFGALLFECTCETSLFGFAVTVGQHKGTPWCEVYSRGKIYKKEDSSSSMKFLEGLVKEMSSRGSFVNLSDRSTILVSNGVVFSAAIRPRPGPNSMPASYTLRTSSCPFNNHIQ